MPTPQAQPLYSNQHVMNDRSALTLHLVGNIPGILRHIKKQFGGEPAFRQYNRDLLVFVADLAHGPLFTEAALRGRGLDFDTAYPMAQANTERLFGSGNTQIIHDGLLGHVDSTGFWPSHLLLMDWFWDDNPLLRIEGELVVGIPTRGELLFSDTAKLPLIPMLMQEVGLKNENGPHRLSGRLFVRRNGAFEPYVLDNQEGAPTKRWWAFWRK